MCTGSNFVAGCGVPRFLGTVGVRVTPLELEAAPILVYGGTSQKGDVNTFRLRT